MPEQFWSLTPHEFNVKWEAFHRSEQRALWLVGQLVLAMIPSEKKPRSPDQLFGYLMIRYPIPTWERYEKSLPDDTDS